MDEQARRALRVLLVDDSAPLRAMLRLLLPDQGPFEVVGEAGDGRRAVGLAAATQPDVVLLDLEMPVLSGLQALPAIRKAAPRARIVVLSAYLDPYTLFDALRLGADLCLDKVGSLASIAGAVEALFEAVSASRA